MSQRPGDNNQRPQRDTVQPPRQQSSRSPQAPRGQRSQSAQTPPPSTGEPGQGQPPGAATETEAQAAGSSVQVAPRPRRATTTPVRGRARVVEAQRRRRLTILLGIGTIIVVAVIVIVAVLSNSSSNGGALTDSGKLNPKTTTLRAGSTFPNFNLATVDGKHYTLSDYKGKPVLVEFFAVWCPHCQHVAPIIDQLNATYKSKGLQVLAVLANPYGRNYDLSGGTDTRLADKGDIQWYTQQFKPSYPLLIDPNFTVVNEVGANSYPTIYTLDKSLKVHSVTQGEVPYSQLAGAINSIVAAK
jgi:thiol-disulfide isomerase/thioredoxin